MIRNIRDCSALRIAHELRSLLQFMGDHYPRIDSWLKKGGHMPTYYCTNRHIIITVRTVSGSAVVWHAVRNKKELV